MGRRYDYNSGSKVPTASGTTVFTSADLPSTGVVAYHLAWDDGNDGTVLSDIARLRLKANGGTLVDCTIAQLLALNQRFGLGRPSYGDRNLMGAPAPAVAGTSGTTQRFTIPLYNLLSQAGDGARDECQFPPGAQVTLEIQWGASIGTTPTIVAGWTTTDAPARAYPKILSSQMNIGASQATGRYNFSEDGVICAYALSTPGMSRARVVISGDQVMHLGGQLANSASDVNGLFLEAQQLDGKLSEIANGTNIANLVSAVVADPLWFENGQKKAAASGSSFIELSTTAAWAGASSELSIYSMVPLSGGR